MPSAGRAIGPWEEVIVATGAVTVGRRGRQGGVGRIGNEIVIHFVPVLLDDGLRFCDSPALTASTWSGSVSTRLGD